MGPSSGVDPLFRYTGKPGHGTSCRPDGYLINMPCFRFAASLLCIGAATTGGLSAQVRGFSPGRAPAPTGSGVGFRYGVILPGHITLYRSGLEQAPYNGWGSVPGRDLTHG